MSTCEPLGGDEKSQFELTNNKPKVKSQLKQQLCSLVISFIFIQQLLLSQQHPSIVSCVELELDVSRHSNSPQIDLKHQQVSSHNLNNDTKSPKEIDKQNGTVLGSNLASEQDGWRHSASQAVPSSQSSNSNTTDAERNFIMFVVPTTTMRPQLTRPNSPEAQLTDGETLSATRTTTTTLTTNMSPLDQNLANETRATSKTPTINNNETNSANPSSQLANHVHHLLDQTNTIVVNSSELVGLSGRDSSGELIIDRNSQDRPTSDDAALVRLNKPARGNSSAIGPRVQSSKGKKFRCNNSSECNNGALCHKGLCFCLPGFTGDTCELDIDECRQFSGSAITNSGDDQTDRAQACLNGGLCIDEVNGFRCQCAPGYQGERCQEEVDLCSGQPEPCKNGATCQNHRTFYECKCLPGFEGKHCETNIDDCLLEPCKNDGKCFDLINDFECRCLPGFKGKQCETNIDDCATSGCFKNTTEFCIDLVNDFDCKCKMGYEGKRCHLDIDDCLKQPCQNNAKCIDLPNDYKCSCQPGWTGKQCQLDIDECAKFPIGPLSANGPNSHQLTNFQLPKGPICQNGGVCENLEPSYKCHCAEGWAGRDCLEMVDYCKAKKPCGKFGKCINTLTGAHPYRCDCLSSYIGQRCDIRRNCLNECHPEHGHCLANTTICACQPTISLDSKHDQKNQVRMCELVSSCEQFEANQLCLNGGKCVNRPNDGGYECLCPDGFEGPICQEFSDKSKLDLVILIIIVSICCVLVAIAIILIVLFRRVRKARATRGTYSPSTQEKFERTSTTCDLLKPPVPERLI